MLCTEFAEIDAALVKARRCAGFHPSQPESQLLQLHRKAIARKLARPSSLKCIKPYMDQSAQKSPGRHHHRI